MRKHIASLLLALVLCVGLAVPALAGGVMSGPYCSTASQRIALDASGSGDGWSFDLDSNTLTLDGFEGKGLAIYNTTAPLTICLADGSVNTLTAYFVTEDTNGIIFTGNGTLNIQSNNGASMIVSDSITVESGTITMNEPLKVQASLTVSGGLLTSAGELSITVGGSCNVTGSGMIILDTAASAIRYPSYEGISSDWTTNLESAAVVGRDGQPLIPKSEMGGTKYYDASGNLSPYAKITAAGAAQTAPVITEDPVVPETSVNPAVPTAYATSYSILVDGQAVAFDAYALRDENGNDTNYLKLRDVAHVLNGSAAQFDVGWDAHSGSISIATGTAYASPNGSEMSTPFSGDQSYTENTSAILINGTKTDLSAITLTDANGGAYTYFKLRDLGQSLGFGVDWDAASGSIVIDTAKP